MIVGLAWHCKMEIETTHHCFFKVITYNLDNTFLKEMCSQKLIDSPIINLPQYNMKREIC